MSTRRTSRTGPPAAALLLAALVGCGGSPDGLPRRPVDGMVIFDGVPLVLGEIQFESEPGQTPAIHQGGVIQRGLFAFSRDEGLVPGRYRVLINSTQAKTPGAPPEEIIPARYNTQTTLEAEIKDSLFNSLTFVLRK